jgi:hypothetical protein
VKTTESGGPRGWDAAKRLKGRKRHVAVDTDGLLLGILVHAADIQDADGLGDLLKRLNGHRSPDHRPELLRPGRCPMHEQIAASRVGCRLGMPIA